MHIRRITVEKKEESDSWNCKFRQLVRRLDLRKKIEEMLVQIWRQKVSWSWDSYKIEELLKSSSEMIASKLKEGNEVSCWEESSWDHSSHLYLIWCIHQALFQWSQTRFVRYVIERENAENIESKESSWQIFCRFIFQHREKAILDLVFDGEIWRQNLRDHDHSWICCFWQCWRLVVVEPRS